MSLTPGQRKTAAVLIVTLGALFLLGVGLLWWEFHSIGFDDQATISETVWALFAAQPGPFVLFAFIFGFGGGFLCGHFFWQSAGKYEEMRGQVAKDGMVWSPQLGRWIKPQR